MPVKMAPHQLRFWGELLSPFPDELLSTTKRGGRELTYVDKRAITNRLDSVCGPDGWYPEYEATARGYKCRLYIRVPMTTEGTWVFMHKEDGAGFEEMGSYNKETKEWEADVDNDEKSGYTNALRRAAQDAWGIGRYLYKKGIPSFLDPNAAPVEHAVVPRTDRSEPGPQLRSAQEAHERASTRAAAPAPAPAPAAAPQKPKYDNFKIPRAGRQVYPWMKEMEKEFETRLFDGMTGEGEKRGWGGKFDSWDQDQVDAICMGAIAFIRDLPTYKGQYDHILAAAEPDQAQAQAPTPSPGPAPGVNVADLRRELITKMTALIFKQTGQQPTQSQLKSTFENVAASSENGDGHTGEVPESLNRLTDIKWIRNMHAFADQQISLALALPEGEEIPF